jgi:hypothetical protein
VYFDIREFYRVCYIVLRYSIRVGGNTRVIIGKTYLYRRYIFYLNISDITLKKRGLCWSRNSPRFICQPPKITLKNEQKNQVCASNGVTYESYNTVACLRIYNHGEIKVTFIFSRS